MGYGCDSPVYRLVEWFMTGEVVVTMFWSRKRKEQELADARAETLRWYDRLGGQIMSLPTKDDPAIKQALVDAGERYNAAGAQLDQATSVRQYELGRETALEGLAYIRAARVAMGLDPGPDLPPLEGQRKAGSITKDSEVDLEGRPFRASPQAGRDTPYYHPGGVVQGRPVPSGWYSEPWWRTALVAGAWGVGSFLIFDALFSPGFGWDHGGFDAGHDAGFQDGLDYADSHGGDPGSDGSGADSGGADAGGAENAGFEAADYGGGDFGGGDFGGGDFGGGDF